MENLLIFLSFAILGVLIYILFTLKNKDGSNKGDSELLQNKLTELFYLNL